MAEEKVMNSPKQNDPKNPKDRVEALSKKGHPEDENQATIEEFDEVGMGVAPKE